MKEGIMKKVTKLEPKGTKCFTYEVNLIIQVFAETEIDSKQKLDTDGGYQSKRDVKLIETTILPVEIKENK